MKVCIILQTAVIGIALAKIDDFYMHKRISSAPKPKFLPGEDLAEYWKQLAQEQILFKIKEFNKNKAKNVILFLGDGMSLATIAATRVYIGAQNNQPGEEVKLAFEEFPYSGISKTYCVDSQVADSACSATAYLCGVKGNKATVGLTAAVPRGDCIQSLNESTHVTSIARWAQLANKRTGFVTTTSVTEASPAGLYANIADRDWESDLDLAKADVKMCKDIAYQLVFGETGQNLNVIMGGGRLKMIPEFEIDDEGYPGERLDGINLIHEWLESKSDKISEYIFDSNGLYNVNLETEYLMGLFESLHCKYNLDKTETEPSLEEMTETAIKVLDKGEGYFLFVEGGKIDHAHHSNWAQKALDETAEFSKAIQKARDITNENETLIVVTSDHAHTMTYKGYAPRGNGIFGFAGEASDGLPYTTISYANGQGYKPVINGERHNLTNDPLTNATYPFPAMDPTDSETHGGDDVGIFASGPWEHLFSGVIEQNVIPHIIAFAMCIGDGITACL